MNRKEQISKQIDWYLNQAEDLLGKSRGLFHQGISFALLGIGLELLSLIQRFSGLFWVGFLSIIFSWIWSARISSVNRKYRSYLTQADGLRLGLVLADELERETKIDIAKAAKHMLKLGLDPDDYAEGGMPPGWSDGLIDFLETEFNLETKVADEMRKIKKAADGYKERLAGL